MVESRNHISKKNRIWCLRSIVSRIFAHFKDFAGSLDITGHWNTSSFAPASAVWLDRVKLPLPPPTTNNLSGVERRGVKSVGTQSGIFGAGNLAIKVEFAIVRLAICKISRGQRAEGH